MGVPGQPEAANGFSPQGCAARSAAAKHLAPADAEPNGPLAALSAPAQAAAMLKIQKVLVPTDFSPVSARVLQYGSDMARAFGASLLVVHVVPPSAYPLINVAGMGHFPNLREEIRKRCEQEMQDLLAKTDAGLQPVSCVIEGVPFTEILELATREKVDLIVMGTHGHTGLKHMVLGSTAERVVRMAACPVLTLRAED